MEPEREDGSLWEDRLRTAAPALPPALRGRVLERSRAAGRAATRRRTRRRWAVTGALASLCAAQMLLLGRLDARREMLITGSTARAADRKTSSSETEKAVRLALRTRANLLSALLHDERGG